MDMDRAAKLKKYGTKHSHPSGQGNAFAKAGVKVMAAAVILIFAAGVLFFVFRFQKEEAALAYVTNAELASCMSFFLDDTLQAEWEEDADAFVTQGQIRELIQNTGLAGTVEAAGGNGRLTREEVMDAYEQILDYLDLEGAVQKKTIVLLALDGTSCQTQDGIYETACPLQGLSCFHTYGVYVKDGRILGIKAESEKTVALRQVQIRSVSKDTIQAVYEQNEYEILCKDSAGMKEIKEASGTTCTLCIKGGAVTKIKDVETDRAPETRKEKQEKLPDTVKVLLLNQGEIHYDQLYLVCDDKWTVKKNGKKTVHKKSDVIAVKKSKIKKGSCMTASPVKAGGRLYFADKKGGRISNGYYGNLAVYRDAQGYYVVNQVPVEKYLYSVVASEMPAAFGMEALKAQAVCARSYVYRQMASEDYSDWHAQIDDSTNYQVYNKSEVVQDDIQAVEETAGEIMYVQDEIVNAYYFSSSFGRTSDMEIWGQKESDYPYLKIKSLRTGQKEESPLDLSGEKDFKRYIRSQKSDAFDSSSRYYRWQAKVEPFGCIKELKEKICLRHDINPEYVSYYSTTKKKPRKTDSMKGFGGVKKMYCSRRGKSGAVLVLTIQFEFGKVLIESEYNIRSILGCAIEQITYADGTVDTDCRFLPSAYFFLSFQKKSGRYILTGGGNGHGMGMSQYGAAGMAREGWDYRQILTFFYDGVQIRNKNGTKG